MASALRTVDCRRSALPWLKLFPWPELRELEVRTVYTEQLPELAPLAPVDSHLHAPHLQRLACNQVDELDYINLKDERTITSLAVLSRGATSRGQCLLPLLARLSKVQQLTLDYAINTCEWYDVRNPERLASLSFPGQPAPQLLGFINLRELSLGDMQQLHARECVSSRLLRDIAETLVRLRTFVIEAMFSDTAWMDSFVRLERLCITGECPSETLQREHATMPTVHFMTGELRCCGDPACPATAPSRLLVAFSFHAGLSLPRHIERKRVARHLERKRW